MHPGQPQVLNEAAKTIEEKKKKGKVKLSIMDLDMQLQLNTLK